VSLSHRVSLTVYRSLCLAPPLSPCLSHGVLGAKRGYLDDVRVERRPETRRPEMGKALSWRKEGDNCGGERGVLTPTTLEASQPSKGNRICAG
jgi:hypothetical protein